MSQGSLNPNIRLLGQKVRCSPFIATHSVTPFQGFRSFSFNLSSRIGPISKWSSYVHCRLSLDVQCRSSLNLYWTSAGRRLSVKYRRREDVHWKSYLDIQILRRERTFTGRRLNVFFRPKTFDLIWTFAGRLLSIGLVSALFHKIGWFFYNIYYSHWK